MNRTWDLLIPTLGILPLDHTGCSIIELQDLIYEGYQMHRSLTGRPGV
jgi:hypothetical protein